MKGKLIIPVVLFTSLLLWLLYFSGIENREKSYMEYVGDHYKIFALESPEILNFSGEEIPLEISDVKERLDRELMVNTYWQSQTLLLHKRANRWFPVIEPILAKNGIPDDFKYLALAESGLDNVVSPAGAVGYWQFLKATGKSYGLEINDEVDERYHVEKSTEAACKYLKDSFDKYGNWTLAAASYNMGANGLDKQIGIQNEESYFDLLLNAETSRYLFRILAMKEILTNSTKYGFYFRPKDLYEPYEVKTVEIDSTIQDWALFAQSNDINYKILKILNPWLRKPYLTNKHSKLYSIKLPAEGEEGLKRYLPTSTD